MYVYEWRTDGHAWLGKRVMREVGFGFVCVFRVCVCMYMFGIRIIKACVALLISICLYARANLCIYVCACILPKAALHTYIHTYIGQN
jgi:hypothetical protein